jgi:hypothetical protein
VISSVSSVRLATGQAVRARHVAVGVLGVVTDNAHITQFLIVWEWVRGY